MEQLSLHFRGEELSPNLLAALGYGGFLRSDKNGVFSHFSLAYGHSLERNRKQGFLGTLKAEDEVPLSSSYWSKSCFIFPLLSEDISGTLDGS